VTSREPHHPTCLREADTQTIQLLEFLAIMDKDHHQMVDKEVDPHKVARADK